MNFNISDLDILMAEEAKEIQGKNWKPIGLFVDKGMKLWAFSVKSNLSSKVNLKRQ